MWDFETKELVHDFQADSYCTVWKVLVTKDCQHLITGSYFDTDIKVFNIKNKEVVTSFKKTHDDRLCAMILTNDDRFVISASWDKEIKMWDIQDKKQAFIYEISHKGAIEALGMSPDSNFFASGSTDASIKLWSLRTRALIYTFEEAHTGTVSGLVITSDARYLASAAADCAIKLWSLSDKYLVHTFTSAHSANIMTLTMSPNDKFIISGSDDTSFRVWDLQSFNLVYDANDVHSDAIQSVAVTSDSRYVISGSADCTVAISDLEGLSKCPLESISKLNSFLLPVLKNAESKKLACQAMSKNAQLPYQRNALHYIALSMPEVDSYLLQIASENGVKLHFDSFELTALDYLLQYRGPNLFMPNDVEERFLSAYHPLSTMTPLISHLL